ncbi:hypothetical protein [Streptomyces sp. AK08-02]|uniref:hypothetical protein n=1 Tax=Streptomyces sp. AK08-02 TaxID=3028654 RepID=UPI0029A757C1|nr:hypothetical protein [Streptomyces sp. AK08-02]MDX3752693.1 hypothetical protein [Streptomyces sp. AK08-02]
MIYLRDTSGLVRRQRASTVSAVDLVIAAPAAHHGRVVLHDEAGYGTNARHAHDVTEHNINDVV